MSKSSGRAEQYQAQVSNEGCTPDRNESFPHKGGVLAARSLAPNRSYRVSLSDVASAIRNSCELAQAILDAVRRDSSDPVAHSKVEEARRYSIDATACDISMPQPHPSRCRPDT